MTPGQDAPGPISASESITGPQVGNLSPYSLVNGGALH